MKVNHTKENSFMRFDNVKKGTCFSLPGENDPFFKLEGFIDVFNAVNLETGELHAIDASKIVDVHPDAEVNF